MAVLPFVNVSPDPDNEYLSDGITDELIDALSKVEALRVASRTSVFALKGRPLDVRAIGATLGVDPGFRTGVKAALVSKTGAVVDTETLYLHQEDNFTRAIELNPKYADAFLGRAIP